MVSLETPVCDFGWKAPDFSLPGTDGKTYALADVQGPNGTLVMFICNHCPYVKAILDRLVRDTGALREKGIGVIAVMANDPAEYTEDSFDNMARVAPKTVLPFLMSWTEARRPPRPTAPSARLISSALTRTWNCNTGAGWIPRASSRRPRTPGATFMRPCPWSPRPVAARQNRPLPWGVP